MVTITEDLEEALTAVLREVRVLRQHRRMSTGRVGEGAGYPLLRQFGRGAARLSDVAAELGVDLSTVSRQVKELTDDGLVERRERQDDARATVVALTPAGRARLGELSEARRAELARLLSAWTAADRDTFARLLARFAADLRATRE